MDATTPTTARDPSLSPYDHEAEISIDLGGILIETEARFADDSEWDRNTLVAASMTLVGWEANESWHSRKSLVDLLSAVMPRKRAEWAVEREEERITEIWAETAEADRADYLADQARDDRADYFNE